MSSCLRLRLYSLKFSPGRGSERASGVRFPMWLGSSHKEDDRFIMPDLRFTIERSQLRGLGILTALVLALAAVGGRAQGLASLIGFGGGALVCLYALIAYLLAVTECTPGGIRTRGLGGPRRCSWSEVADISLRYGPRSVLIAVTTTHGRRFWLGAPVEGGVMRDPEIDRKLARIQAYWRWAAAEQESHA